MSEELDLVETEEPEFWTPYLACAYAEGFGEGERATEEQYIAAFQYLIDSGLAWQLQGWYGRTARHLIEQGACIG